MYQVFRALAALVCVLAVAPAAQAQLASAYQTSLNRYSVSFTPTYALDFESGDSHITTLAPQVSITTSSGEVISGSRSLKLDGPAAYAQIRAEMIALQPNRFYIIDLKYRITRAGRFGVVLRSPGATSEYTMLGELGPSAASGSVSWSVLVPPVQGSTLLFYAIGATVTVDDIQVLAQLPRMTRASIPTIKAAFPRLGDYMLLSPAAIASMHGVDPGQADSTTARYDLLVGPGFDHTQGAGAWLRSLRQQNPNLLVLPYRQAFMAQFDTTTGLQAEFNTGLGEGWFMHTPSGARLSEPAFPQNVQLNHTPSGALVSGQSFADYSTGFLARKVLPSGLWDGIQFDQAEWYINPLLGEPPPAIDLNSDGVADAVAVVQRSWAEGFSNFFRTLQRKVGFTQLTVGNAGYISANPSALGALNGWISERTSPYPTDANGNWITTAGSDWYRLLNNYLMAGNIGRAPQLPLLEFTGTGLGTATGTWTPNGLPMRTLTLEARDYRRMRFGLTTTLLGNGFFEYDLVDNTTPSLWFDEYAVDANGTATTTAAGKGYLGQPLGDAVELPYTSNVLFNLTFDTATAPPSGVYISGRLSASPAEAISGTSLVITKASPADFAWFLWSSGLVVPGRTYQLLADYRILASTPQTFQGIVGLGLQNATDGMPTPRTGSLFMQDVDGPGQTGTLRASVKAGAGESVLGMLFDAGTVSMDNIQLIEGTGGVWRRDFENGIVLVNPTPDPITVTLTQVAGSRGRTGIKRIRGSQVATWNTGSAVTTGITIPSADGIVLLANRIAPVALTAPANLTASVAGASATLAWSTSAGYAAAYHIAYGEDPQGLTRVAAAGRQGKMTLDDLQPGATYYARVAAVDFRGNVGPYSAAVAFTIAGATATRPAFGVSGLVLVPGSMTTVSGSGLADGFVQLSAPYPTRGGNTRVEVNGVEAPLYRVSPTEIVFITPWELSGADAVVNVIRSDVPGIERLVPRADAQPYFFTSSGTTAYALHQNGTPVTAASPARANETIDLFATGLGAVMVPPDTGASPASGWQAATAFTPSLLVGGMTATPVSSQVEPGMIAVYRIRVTIPAVAAGVQPADMMVAGTPSNRVTLPIQ